MHAVVIAYTLPTAKTQDQEQDDLIFLPQLCEYDVLACTRQNKSTVGIKASLEKRSKSKDTDQTSAMPSFRRNRRRLSASALPLAMFTEAAESESDSERKPRAEIDSLTSGHETHST